MLYWENKGQENMARALKKRASTLSYQSTGQLYLEGYDKPITFSVDPN